MSSLTAGWILSGASSQWKNAKPGKVFDALVNGSYANPVITVDEIDKASPIYKSHTPHNTPRIALQTHSLKTKKTQNIQRFTTRTKQKNTHNTHTT
ncbi:hypothetical protein, partial [Bradyrhizobium canariense]|uniref:hypothetical protein n=1 Tax=Bradyrhizobium canariense TaxID=255045 RepID=UPI003F7B5E80